MQIINIDNYSQPLFLDEMGVLEILLSASELSTPLNVRVENSTGDNFSESYLADFEGKVIIDLRVLFSKDFSFELPEIGGEVIQGSATQTYTITLSQDEGSSTVLNLTVIASSSDASTTMSDIDIMKIPADYILPISCLSDGEHSGVEFITSTNSATEDDYLTGNPDTQSLITRLMPLSATPADGAESFRMKLVGRDVYSPHYVLGKGHFEQYLFLNRFGGYDNIAMSGDRTFQANTSHETGKYGGREAQRDSKMTPEYLQHSGYMSAKCVEAFSSLICSGQIFHLQGGVWKRIVIIESDVQCSDADDLHSFSFKYKYTDGAFQGSRPFSWLAEVFETGFNLSLMWWYLLSGTEEQINKSHLVEALAEYITGTDARREFISKLDDDIAAGRITFQKGLESLTNIITSQLNVDTILSKTGDGISFAEAVTFSDTIRANKPAAFLELLTAVKGVVTDTLKSPDYAEGIGFTGSGFGIVPVDGGHRLDIDFLKVKKGAEFFSLVIQQLKHQGGMVIYSAAALECTKVEIVADGYKCYFDTKDGSVPNEFAAGDLARCQRFDMGTTSAKYYWRAVTELGDDYIVLSQSDCDPGSGAPGEGDVIVQLGNRFDRDRQQAKICTVIGPDSPRDEYYDGINSYSLEGRLVTVVGMYDPDGGTNYQMGVYTKNGRFDGQVAIGKGSTGLETFTEWSNKQALIEEAKTIAEQAAASADSAIEGVQDALAAALQAKTEAIAASKDYTDEAKEVINNTISALDQAKANLLDVYSKTEADGLISAAEQDAIDAAQEALDAKAELLNTTLKAYADGKVSEEEARAIADATAKANAAQAAAEAKAQILHEEAIAYVNSQVTAALDAADQAKTEAIAASKDYTDKAKEVINNTISALDQAKADLTNVYTKAQADNLISAAEQDAIDAAQEALDAKAELLNTTLKAYADGKVSEEEARAIADATAKANAAQAAAEAKAAIAQATADQALSAADRALQAIDEINDDTILTPSEKAALRMEWVAINGTDSLTESSTSGTYYRTRQKFAESLSGVTTELGYNGNVYSYLIDGQNQTISYKLSGISRLDAAYLELRGYLYSIGLNDEHNTYINFSRNQLTALLAEYYDAETDSGLNYTSAVDEKLSEEVASAIASADQAKADAIAASKNYTDEAKSAVNKTIADLDAAKADLTNVYTKAQADNKISEAEEDAISAAQTALDAKATLLDQTLKAYADGKVSEEEARAIADAKAKADAAQAAAEAKAQILHDEAIEYIDSKVTGALVAAEQAKIDAIAASKGYTDEAKSAVNKTIADLDAAKADLTNVYTKAQADNKISEAEEDAISAAQAALDAKAALLDATLKAYADGKVSEEEARAIADATAKANAAQAAAEVKAAEAQATADAAQIDATKALASIAIINDDTILTPSEKAALRTEWAAINGTSSLTEAGISGTYCRTRQSFVDKNNNVPTTLAYTLNGSRVTFTYRINGVQSELNYNRTGLNQLDTAYQNLREYLYSIGLNDEHNSCRNFDREKLIDLLASYYDAETISTLNHATAAPKAVIDGGLITNGGIELCRGEEVKSKNVRVGMTAEEDGSNNPVMIFAGSTKANRQNAPYKVYEDGTFEGEKCKLRGELVAGTPNGQRIEILPETKEIKGYDENGKNIISISGNNIDPDSYLPSEVTSLLSNTPQQTSYKTYNSGETAVMGTFTVTEGLRIRLSISTLRAYTSSTSIEGSIRIALQKMSSPGSSVVSETIISTAVQTVVGSINAVSNSATFFAQLKPGYYRLVRIISLSGTCNFSWSVSAYVMNSLLHTDIFRNGLSIVQNADNFCRIFADGTGNIHHDVKVGGVSQPITVFDAYVEDTESTTAIGADTPISPKTVFVKPSENLVIRKRSTVGQYEFLIPSGLGWDCDTLYTFRPRMSGARGVMGGMFCSNYSNKYWAGFTVTRYNAAGQPAYGPFDIEILAYN